MVIVKNNLLYNLTSSNIIQKIIVLRDEILFHFKESKKSQSQAFSEKSIEEVKKLNQDLSD